MEVFTMVAIIVVASVSAGVINNYLKLKNQRDAEDLEAGSLEELDELRRRVETLEEIVTDKQFQLRTELANLERNGD